MKTAFFSTKPYDQKFFNSANQQHRHDLTYFDVHLNEKTAVLARDYPAICAFVIDHLNEKVLQQLKEGGTRLIALRSAGFNNVDLKAATKLGLTVLRVPAYSPYAVAEHTVALMLALNRKIHRAHQRVREGNLDLSGLMGFDLHGKSVGIIGTGKIGAIVCRILAGFGCHLLATDLTPNPECEKLGARYVGLPELFSQADIITLHIPLTPKTHHLIDSKALQQMKPGVMLINTSRGAIVDTDAIIRGLKTGKVGYLGMDVYEEEDEIFFQDLSNKIIQDDVFARLQTFPNVLITGHQGFFTEEAMKNIAETTLQNISDFEAGKPSPNQIQG